jgi:hypothetical protein
MWYLKLQSHGIIIMKTLIFIGIVTIMLAIIILYTYNPANHITNHIIVRIPTKI